ncbi:MAG: biopolymer transporter ExbD [Planctomycetota bacterium]
MRPPDSVSRRDVGANMTPMIDVVFLLIIFFLVSSHLARQETRMPVDLPIAGSPGPVDPLRNALTITVTDQGKWMITGREVKSTELPSVLNDYRSQQGPSAAIRIRTDRAATYRSVEPLLRDAAKAGLFDVSLSVRKEAS